jgi:hypothetical protein
MFTHGDKAVPTMILEAVASQDLRIWHFFFGVAGAQNDINVLNKSPLFIEAIKGKAPRVHFNVNGNDYEGGYYLADKFIQNGRPLSSLYQDLNQKKTNCIQRNKNR